MTIDIKICTKLNVATYLIYDGDNYCDDDNSISMISDIPKWQTVESLIKELIEDYEMNKSDD